MYTGRFRGSFVLPDGRVFGDTAGEELRYEPLHPDEHRIKTKGTFTEWQANISNLCVGNTHLVFALSIGFAAPLAELFKQESAIFHIFGSTSQTIARCLATLLGSGADDGFMRHWNSTASGLMEIAAQHNGQFMILDELGRGNPHEVGGSAYDLISGAGRQRAKSHGGAQKTQDFRTLFFSTGELTMREFLLRARKYLDPGQEVRMLSLPANAECGLGCFENLHGSSDSEAFASMIEHNAKENYGWAFPLYLERFFTGRRASQEFAEDVHAKFIAKVSSEYNLTGAEKRCLKRFALVAAGGELATYLGVTGWPGGHASWAASVCFNRWLTQRREQEKTNPAQESNYIPGRTSEAYCDARTGARRVLTFIRDSGEARFQDLKPGSIHVDDRAGFREGSMYYFYREVFRNVVANYDPKKVLHELQRLGALFTNSSENNKRLTCKKRIAGERPDFYGVQFRTETATETGAARPKAAGQ